MAYGGEDLLSITFLNNGSVSEELDQFCRKEMISLVEKLKNHPDLPKLFHLYCDTILATFNRGINQQLLVQLLEVGAQSFFGLRCPMECMAFENKIYEEQQAWVRAGACDGVLVNIDLAKNGSLEFQAVVLFNKVSEGSLIWVNASLEILSAKRGI